jgi:hypothetical protein
MTGFVHKSNQFEKRSFRKNFNFERFAKLKKETLIKSLKSKDKYEIKVSFATGSFWIF